MCLMIGYFFFFKQKTAYEMRISDWSSDVCSSDLWCEDDHEVDRRKRAHREELAERHQCPERGASHLACAGVQCGAQGDDAVGREAGNVARCQPAFIKEIGSASCRERVCQYV